MSNHTPGPWQLGKNGDQCARNHAICSGPVVIAKVYGRGYPAGEGWSPESEADAAFIVRACNSHEELLAALEDCIESLSRLPNLDGAYRITCIAQAQAALTKVKGESQC